MFDGIFVKGLPMKEIVYNKLVRDRIPAIIRADGKACETEVLDDDAFLAALDKKMTEELREYEESHSAEELADLLEVIYAAADVLGYGREQLEALRIRKAEKRGGFRQKIFLKTVREP